MQNDKPDFGYFGAEFKMRVPGDFMPRLHAHARSKGLSSSALVRMLVIAELDHAGRIDDREAA